MNENQEKLALVVAETILANTKLLQALVDTLPKHVADVVVKTVTKEVKATPKGDPVQVSPTPVAPVVTPEPVAQTMVVSTTPAIVNVEPVAAPAPVAPVVTPEPVAAPAGKAPFTNQTELVKWVMSNYQRLGPIKGAGIQNVLTNLGYKNINEIKPEHYDSLFAQISVL